ncbi:hypothetical protein N7468_007529 [Penicillium chermesinum]|uniref:Uncharacterized protein n=1 Tax=Penicillium chermesinum TaxID=63820 RepID=A0A9W9NUF2_9EURO|nr:uncharacterized protein N7468_007529 [Penicillium chermesinum]KAJ5226304.1 hypothetical protein N7468_007529 [Penicillium chermesinum]KAJ6160510.1 hypothetical protein N7470_003906 [Penicillium chermesinum]
MKISAAILTSCLAASATAFDKWQPWGKRDYSCLNVYQGIPDSATLTPGQTVHLRFNREPTSHCADPLAKYPADKYSIFLYNNPVRNRDVIDFDQSIKIATGVDGSSGAIDVKIPAHIPKVKDGDVWYLRVGTELPTAPQMPSLFHAAGPFTIRA